MFSSSARSVMMMCQFHGSESSLWIFSCVRRIASAVFCASTSICRSWGGVNAMVLIFSGVSMLVFVLFEI